MSLADQNCAEVRDKLLEVEIIITHEILLVFGKLLYQIC